MRRSSLLAAALLSLAAAGAGGCSSGVRVFDRVPSPTIDGVPPPERVAVRSAPSSVAFEPAPAPLRTASPAAPRAPVRARRAAGAFPPAPAPASDSPPAPAPVARPCAPAADDADEGLAMLAAANAERAARGLRPLRWDERLHRAAFEHSAEQARHGYLGHGSPDPARDDLRARVRMAGYEPQKWAEVVGWNYANAAHVTQGWMDSRGHREILLDPTLVDAGFARVGAYFTGDFGIPYASR